MLRGVLRREERLAWLLLGLGVCAWVLGELYFTAVLWADKSPPIPSPADAGYLSLPPLVFAGLWCSPARGSGVCPRPCGPTG